MKKSILIIVMLFFKFNIYSQIPVTDASAGTQLTALNTQATVQNQNLAQQLSTAGSQLTQLQKTYDQIKKASEKVEKVNAMISTGQQIKKITSTLNDVRKNYQACLNYINNQDLIKPAEKAKFIFLLTSVISKSVDDLDDVTLITSNGAYNMTDAERLKFLNEINEKITHQNNLIQYFYKKIQSAVATQMSKKKSQEFINKSVESLKK